MKKYNYYEIPIHRNEISDTVLDLEPSEFVQGLRSFTAISERAVKRVEKLLAGKRIERGFIIK